MVDDFTNILTIILEEHTLKNGKTILLGDFNINLLKHTTHPLTNNFLLQMQSHNFFPHICCPTRFPDSQHLGAPSLLDHIYTNFASNFTSGIIHFPVSDHLPVFLNIPLPTKHKTLHRVEFRDMSQQNKLLFMERLFNINWNDILVFDNIDTNFNLFSEILSDHYDACFPKKCKYLTEKRMNKPWITQTVINSIKTKNNLYKDYKIGAVTEAYYKQYRNILNATIKNSKITYYTNLFTNFKNSTRKMWSAINQLRNDRKIRSPYNIQNNKNSIRNS